MRNMYSPLAGLKHGVMSYNEKLTNNVRELIAATHRKVEEKKMFGGLCFMVDDKMCVGVNTGRMMVRLDPAIYETVLEQEGCTPMVHGGRMMKGYVYVSESALTTKKKLEYWINLALAFNLVAQPAKKKK